MIIWGVIPLFLSCLSVHALPPRAPYVFRVRLINGMFCSVPTEGSWGGALDLGRAGSLILSLLARERAGLFFFFCCCQRRVGGWSCNGGEVRSHTSFQHSPGHTNPRVAIWPGVDCGVKSCAVGDLELKRVVRAQTFGTFQ